MNGDVTSNIRVRYAETDAWGVVYHANYIIYFEVGRGDFVRACGGDWRALEATGVSMVVAEVQVRYHAPAHYDEELTLYTKAVELRTRSMRFEYRVLRGDTLIATGWSAHVMVDRQGKPTPIPDSLRRQVLEAGLGPDPSNS